MTTDPFIEAARAEAERYFADPGADPLTLSVIDHAMHMAEWARAHLAAQEPTDAEVESAARHIALCDQIDFDDLVRRGHGLAGQYRRQACAALSAARAARRDEEKL